MKFEVETRDITSQGALMSRKITLSANAKAYRLLFGQIYPDIIKAIVREIFTNAWDSQKVAGNLDTPIEIHLPTEFEPWFSIRDFGTGMTPEIIDNVYAIVFESTKDDSNEEAGMFGMGSKTPLGYTDAFSVISYVDGMMRAYDIYVNPNGEAQLDLKYEGETDEPNGVHVQVGVRREDFDNFKNHAELFALHAGTPVNINRQRILNTRKELMSGENWVLYERNEKFEDAMFVRMGCVLYRLDTRMMFDNLPPTASWRSLPYDETSQIKQLFNMPIILDFPIGTFDVTGSREDIVYSAESSEKIYNRVVNDVVNEIRDQISFDINNTPNFGEAYRIARIYHHSKLISDRMYRTLKWKSWTICHADRYINQRTNTQVCYQPYTSRRDALMRSFTTKSIDPSSLYDPDTITYIVFDDQETKRVYSRLLNLYNQLLNAGLRRSSYYANLFKSGKPKMFNLIWVNSKKLNWRRFERILPTNYIIINLEDIMVTPPKKREPKEEVEVDYDVYHIRDSGWELKINGWTAAPKSKYFVRTHRRKFLISEDAIRSAAAALGIDINTIVAINTMSESCIEHHELLDLIEEADKVRDSITFNESTVFYNAMSNLRTTHGNLRWYVPAKEAVAMLMKIDYKHDDVSENYVSTVNEKVESEFNAMFDRIVAFLEDLYVKYPILKYVQHANMQDDENLIEVMKILGEIE